LLVHHERQSHPGNASTRYHKGPKYSRPVQPPKRQVLSSLDRGGRLYQPNNEPQSNTPVSNFSSSSIHARLNLNQENIEEIESKEYSFLKELLLIQSSRVPLRYLA
jgi:hypothetical protein